MKEIEITTDYIKLESALKFAALVYSGGEAKTVIAEGLVFVNNEICTMRGKKLRSGDIVRFMGNEIKIVDAN